MNRKKAKPSRGQTRRARQKRSGREPVSSLVSILPQDPPDVNKTGVYSSWVLNPDGTPKKTSPSDPQPFTLHAVHKSPSWTLRSQCVIEHQGTLYARLPALAGSGSRLGLVVVIQEGDIVHVQHTSGQEWQKWRKDLAAIGAKTRRDIYVEFTQSALLDWLEHRAKEANDEC